MDAIDTVEDDRVYEILEDKKPEEVEKDAQRVTDSFEYEDLISISEDSETEGTEKKEAEKATKERPKGS